jgi:carboxypeptidase PM20D1
MKRVTLGIAVILLILVAVMVTRTMQIAAPVDSAEASASPPPPGADSMVVANHLSQAIKFETVSYGGGIKEKERNEAIANFREWMDRTYPYVFEAAPQELVGESLLFTWRGTNPNLAPVLLMAHMDVVPVVPGTEKDWTHAPFSGDIADGFVWGRGSIDNKSSLIAILEAGERIAMSGYQPERTIMFAFGQDEEVGGVGGNGAIAKALQARGVRFAWVLDEGSPIMNVPYPGVRRPVALIGVGEKGYLTLELTAHGTGGHSARPTRDLALPRLASAINNVVGNPFVSDFDDIQRAKLSILTPLVPFADRMALANLWLTKPLVLRELEAEPAIAAVLHTTISPTILEAGIKDNVIPPTALAKINFRLHQRDTIASVVAHVKSAINDEKVDVNEGTETRHEASRIVALDDPVYLYLAQKIQESFAVPVAPELMTGATDSSHYLDIADAVLRFRPFPADPDDLVRVHGTNERIAVDDLGRAVGFYMRLLRDLK